MSNNIKVTFWLAVCASVLAACGGERLLGGDAGSVTVDGGDTGADAGVVEPDGGDVDEDTGVPGPDAGDSGTDVGLDDVGGGDVGEDAGIPEPDAGDGGVDSGVVEPDGGDAGEDSGGDGGTPACTSFDTPVEDCADIGGTAGVMCRIPAGCFWSGCNAGVDPQCDWYDNLFPYQSIYLPEYYIDKHEVTTAEYMSFLAQYKCVQNPQPGTDNLSCHYGRVGRAGDPMNCLSWDAADSFCRYLGKRLPNSAQWEKAARGTDARLYPWGDSEANCGYTVMNVGNGPGCGANNTMPVGSKPNGKSPYGAEDMSGNVAEMIAETPNDRILAKGGSFKDGDPHQLRTYHTAKTYIETLLSNDEAVGCRCVASEADCIGADALPRAYVNLGSSTMLVNPDGGYWIVGNSMQCDPDRFTAVLSIASDGRSLWQKTYYQAGGSGASAGTTDGGILLVANNPCRIIKLTKEGAVDWAKTIPGISVLGMRQTADDGYMLAGNIGSGNGDSSVVKLTPTGDVEWIKSYGGTQQDTFNSIIQTDDGGFLATGTTKSFKEGEYYWKHIWVVKLNESGGLEWQNQYGLPSRDLVLGLFNVQVADGGLVITGHTSDLEPYGGGAPSDVIVMKLGRDGSIAWQHGYSAGLTTYAKSLTPTADGGFLLGAHTRNAIPNGAMQGANILKFKSDGELEWQRLYGEIPAIGCAGLGLAGVVERSLGGFAVSMPGKLPRVGPYPVNLNGWFVTVVAELNAVGSMVNGPNGLDDTTHILNLVDPKLSLTVSATSAIAADLAAVPTDQTIDVSDIGTFAWPNCWK